MRVAKTSSEEQYWVQDVAEACPPMEGTFFPAASVKYVESKKGFLVRLDLSEDEDNPFKNQTVQAFVWRNSDQGKMIEECLMESWKARISLKAVPSYPQLFVEVTRKKNCSIGIDDIDCDDEAYFFTGEGLDPGAEYLWRRYPNGLSSDPVETASSALIRGFDGESPQETTEGGVTRQKTANRKRS